MAEQIDPEKCNFQNFILVRISIEVYLYTNDHNWKNFSWTDGPEFQFTRSFLDVDLNTEL